ncbi:5-carboxymethyl-2-hydroxymuconate Delta-isomerase [Neisseria sp.]|uniref:5-carboxymethyl-2-hydroxymuconate Delta-isomerase n=1 Tax=Neisseria sp. TaxID=192066 RepID=UPI0026DBE7D1|nr:5-carboxymethyl-2-hydroxymuconate Delta-isomerase [Neisseria sp.]MDO4228050.1 5-carboxymethyl-2-hydroxymuconate Delta-isomerase [Neisseria sp.]
MPHLIVEYSNNLNLPVQPLLHTLHGVLLASGQFEEDHIKVRARRYDDYLTGGSAADGFVHITLFLLDGRSEAVKHALSQALGDAVQQALGSAAGTQITVDTRDMVRATYAKTKI